MWRRVELSNYRSIQHASIDLGPFTILVGPNGSGKSNFADALVFARDLGVDAASAVSRRGGASGIRRWTKTKPTDVTIDIRASTLRELLDIDYVRHRFTIHSGREGKWSFRRELVEIKSKGTLTFQQERQDNRLVKSFPRLELGLRENTSVMLFARQLPFFRPRQGLSQPRRFRLNPDAMRQPQAISEINRLDESGANIAAAVRNLRERSPTVFADLLHSMKRVVPGLKDITVGEVGRYLSLEFSQEQAGGVATFSATEISEGAIRALGIMVAAKQMQRNELLIVEEPEVNIHAGAAGLLFDVLKHASSKGAVLVTTHSADLLDAARDEEILVCDYQQGVTRIGPLATEQREIVRQGLFSLAELMRSEPLRIEGTKSALIGPGGARTNA